jgi:hypothetical protein
LFEKPAEEDCESLKRKGGVKEIAIQMKNQQFRTY